MGRRRLLVAAACALVSLASPAVAQAEDLFATVGPDTAFFPTIFLAAFAIGLGIGTAFMPLLTIAMADVPEITDVTAAAEQYVKRLSSAKEAASSEGVAALADSAHAIRRSIAALQATSPRIPVFAGG